MAYKFFDPAPYRFKEGALFLGLDQRGQEIGYETEIHALTVGGSGAGKGSALLVPNARRWPHNLLVIDPKGENTALSWKAREALGQRVAVIDPFGQTKSKIPARLRVAVNPLADIDAASPRARAAILALGSGLVVAHDPRHMEWTEGARSILSGLCAYVVADAPPEKRTFAMVREMLMQRDDLLIEDAHTMATDARMGGLIRAAGVMIATALTSQKGMEKDFLGQARRSTQWLDDDAIAASLGHSDFRLSDLKTGKASLFLVLPPDYIGNYSAFLRLFVKAALHEMGKPEGGARCLFLLDEFFSLGKLEEVAEAAGRMRSMGVTLWPFVQGLGQLHDLYGKEGSQTFMTNAAVHCFLGNDKDATTLHHISRTIGALTPDEIRDAPPVPKTPAAEFSAFRDQQEQAIENENARRTAADKATRARAAYDHDMKRVGQPRLAPDEIAALIGKDQAQGDIVARSMIVFLPAGKVLNLRLAPYFMTGDSPPHNEARATEQPAMPQKDKARAAPPPSPYLDDAAPVAAALRRQVFGAPVESYNIGLSVVGCDLLFAVLLLRAFGGPYDLQSFFLSCFFVAPAAMIAGALAAWLIRDISSPVIPLGLWKFIGWPAFAAVIAFALTGSGPVALSVGALTFAGFFLWAIWRIRPV